LLLNQNSVHLQLLLKGNVGHTLTHFEQVLVVVNFVAKLGVFLHVIFKVTESSVQLGWFHALVDLVLVLWICLDHIRIACLYSLRVLVKHRVANAPNELVLVTFCRCSECLTVFFHPTEPTTLLFCFVLRVSLHLSVFLA
jgi:hypothetical protein